MTMFLNWYVKVTLLYNKARLTINSSGDHIIKATIINYYLSPISNYCFNIERKASSDCGFLV